MKNLTFNFKSIVQTKARWLLTFCALLTLGVGQMWAETKPIYLEFPSWWTNSGANTFVQVRKNNDNDNDNYITSPVGLVTGTTNVYLIEVDVNVKRLIFLRVNGNSVNNDWSNVWNRSVEVWVNQDAGQANDRNHNYFKIHSTNTYGDTGYRELESRSKVANTGGDVYLVKPSGFTNSYKYIAIGRNNHTSLTSLTAITNTNLLYCSPGSYTGASYMAFFANSEAVSSGSWGYSKIESDYSQRTDQKLWYNLNSGSAYLATSSGTSDLEVNSIGSDYNGLNKNQTVYKYTSVDNGSTYSAANYDAGTVTISAVKMKSASTANNTDNSASINAAGTTSTSVYAVYTGTVTLTASEKTGYSWVGWFDVASGGSAVETNRSYSYTAAHSEKSMYARFKANQYTITLYRNDDTDNYDTQTATYDQSATSLSGLLPTRTGYGFDGYWTTADNSGTRVVDKNGIWIDDISGFTDEDTKWICTSNKTLYAHWLATGYYLAGKFNDWEGTHPFSGSPLTATIALSNTGAYLSGGKTTFKIRQVNESSSTGSSESWYSRNVEIGKSSTTADNLATDNDPITLQVYYTGDYEFTLDVSGSKPEVTVAVPVIDELQIYRSSPSGGTGIANHSWGSPVESIVSKTVTLSGGKTYEFKAVYESVFYGLNSGSVSDGDSLLLNSSGGDVSITTTRDGDYQFEFNIVTHKIIVTYPESYSITVAAGTGISEVSGNVTYAAPNTDYPISATVMTGYTWSAWEKSGTGATNAIVGSTASTNAQVVDGNTTFTANATENISTITINTPDSYKGSLDYTGDQSLGITTGVTVTATPAAGFMFDHWDYTGVAVLSTTTDATTTIKTDGTASSIGTVTAVFVPRYAVIGSLVGSDSPGSGMPGWSDYSKTMDYNATNDFRRTLCLEGNKTYKFRLRDLKDNCNLGWKSDGTTTLNASETTFNETTGDVKFATDGSGDITFKIVGFDNGYPQVRVLCDFTSSMVTYNNYSFYVDGTSNTETTGGSISSAIDGNSYIVASGNKVKNGGSMTFTADITDGYTFDGWYTDNDFEDGDKISAGGNYAIDGNTLTVSSISADLAIYAKFVENSTAVTIAHNEHGHVTIDGVIGTSTTTGVTTTRTITAVPDAGYYFAGWTLSDGADFTLDDNTGDEDSEVTMHGIGAGTASSLTANFVELEKIYFRNWNEGTSAPLWSDVYVYFSIYTEKSGDDECAKSNVDVNYFTQMTQVGATNIYWAYVPRGTTKYSDRRIAFSNHNFGANYKFQNYEASMRNDYDKTLNMFVPYRTVKSTKNGTKYYDDGYWKTYGNLGEKSGYYINRWNVSAYVNPASKGTGDDFQFVITGENTIEYELRIDNSGNDYNSYDIVSLVGTKYNTSNSASVGTAITMSNCETGLELHDYQNNPRFSINPSSHGIYKITIDQSSDKMKIYVNYPVMLNDYRIKHTYTIDAKTYTAYSDILKNSQVSSGVTASMYINKDNTPTLTLEKCTDVSTTPVTWTQQGDDLWSTYGSNFDEGNGVYKFDVTINTSTNAITSIANCVIYDGEFYIKTDIAPGGWTAWKANIMEKNSITFDSDNPKTFDYAFCHWVGSTSTNVKCVIANDYNIAVSDTLESDAILGGSSQTLPSAAHVRFSYNSTTNELKRTYLSLAGENKLQLEGNTVSSASMIRNTDGTTFTNNATTLTALSNFTYKVDVQAREKARVRLTSIYQSNNQSLVGTFTSTGSDLDSEDHSSNTVEVLGGSTSNIGYKTMRIIYDFKTNYVMAAWLVDDDVNVDKDTALQADLMIIRQEQSDAYQLTFGDNKSMTEVKKVYGVMKFTKSFITDNTQSRYKRDLYWISFPFDVKLSDAFGLGTYGTHWIIEYYDGVGRARNGFWADSEPNWKFVTPYMREHGGEDGQGYILNANEGYILALDLDELGGESLVWDNGMTEAYLYFPSNDDVVNIQNTTAVVDLGTPADYYCSINRGTTDGDRRVKDSYWHCIGVPSFAEASSSNITSDGEATIVWQVENGSLPFLYQWQGYTTGENTLEVVSTSGGSSFTFQPMYSYLVQYNQQYMHWSAVTNHASVAARITETPDKEYKLVLSIGEEEQDKAMLRLTDKEGVTNRFEFNQDLSKEYNAGKANIWTVTADTVEVAGNSMPKPVQTTVVPVGVKVVANGEYTFSMPEGTNGENVVLIDNAYGTRTNLGLMPYTVTLTAGTYDSRFALEFGPIQDAPTGIEQMSTVNYQLSTEEVRKVFVGGRLYIIRDGKVYDAAGQRVE